MTESRFYSMIKFPIENNFAAEYYLDEEKISFLNFIFLVPFRILETTFLKILGLNLLIDRSWPSSCKRDKDFLDRVINPFIFLDHSHVIKTSFGLKLELNHFVFIFLRKFKLVGSKGLYPQCLETNFGLKAIYELSHLRQKPIFTSEYQSEINQLFFDTTSSFGSLLEGRRIIGTISDEDYGYIKSKYLSAFKA